MLGQVWFVTLTYPETQVWEGAQYKAHLRALRGRIERKYGQCYGVWKMEFQWKTRGGVPHFHLMVRLPGAGLPNGPQMREFRQEIGRWWYEIVGSNDEKHRRVGTGVEVARTDCARYFSYALSEKERQNVAAVAVSPGPFLGGVASLR